MKKLNLNESLFEDIKSKHIYSVESNNHYSDNLTKEEAEVLIKDLKDKDGTEYIHSDRFDVKNDNEARWIEDVFEAYKNANSDWHIALNKLDIFKEKDEPINESADDVEAPKLEEPTQQEVHLGLADMIGNLIKSEYDAISDYNNAIATILAENSNEDLINIFKDILNEENNHVGMLLTALKQVSPAAQEIKGGEVEGEEKLKLKENEINDSSEEVIK